MARQRERVHAHLEYDGSERALAHAKWLDPDGFPTPPRLSDAEVQSVVLEAISNMHSSIKDYLQHVPIIIEEMPSLELLNCYDPPASPLDLLGMFQGASMESPNVSQPWTALPPAIVIFQRNLARHSVSKNEMIQQLKITLTHEVGHFLGLSSEELANY